MDDKQGFIPREEPKDIRFKTPTFIDPLTGLFNQYYLYRFLPEEMQRAKLGNYPLAIFMLDLDDFKTVNDNYGHLCGDEVLKQLAVILKKFVRRTDMVVRYAGDEFMILLPTTDRERGKILANKFITEVANSIFKGKDDKDMHLTMSVGLAVYPEDAQEIDKLIERADKALYLSKQKGKNRISESKEVTLEAASYVMAMDFFPCLKFIDRQEELNSLKDAFDTVVAKSNLLHIAFVSGEAGVGKTRLLNELNNYAQEQAAIPIACRCSSVHTQDSYYLFGSGISAYINKMGVDDPVVYNVLSKIPPVELAELSRIVPSVFYFIKRPVELREENKTTRFLLFKSFLDFLVELNKVSPVVISFDDIHWADRASLELLRYLIKEEKNKKIFIACSFTEDKNKQIPKESDFRDLWEDIHFNANFTHIRLLNFSLENTSWMIEAIFPGIIAERKFYDLIHSTTKGNPSFIEEILKSLVEDAVIFYQDNCWHIKRELSSQDIPFSIQEVIKKRLKKLDDETKEIIVQAAVIGDDFSLDILKKIDNKDEGFMLEILQRAKKMHLVNELEQKGKYGFINKHVQDLLYNGINDAQRDILHYKVGQVIAEEYKNNIYNVAGELSFHFAKASQQAKAREYSAAFLEKAAQVFSPNEITEYLEKLTREIISEERRAPPISALSEGPLKETLRFIHSLQGAIKNFQLYPPGTVRKNVVNEAYLIISGIWQEDEHLSFVEVEKSLVINGKRISPKEVEHSSAENLLDIMIEHNLKTISFIKGLSREGLEKVVECLSKPYAEIVNEGGWKALTEGIVGIKIEEVDFLKGIGVGAGKGRGGFAEKKKLEDIMLMKFLLGKVERGSVDTRAVINAMEGKPKKFAQVIMNAAQEIIKDGKAKDEKKAVTDTIEHMSAEILGRDPEVYSDYAKHLARIALELEPPLRNKIIRSQLIDRESSRRQIDDIVAMLPDEVIIEILIEEYEESQKNPLVLKEYMDRILTDDFRKKEIALKLETELLKLNMAREDIAFVVGHIKWEELPLTRRLNHIMGLPDKYYASEMGKIKAFLQGVDFRQDSQELENLIYHFIVKSGQLEPKVGSDLIEIATDFIKAPFLNDKIDIKDMEGKLGGLLKRLNAEAEPRVLASILYIFRGVIKEFTFKLRSAKDIILELEKTTVRRKYVFIQQLLSILSQRFKCEENRNSEICKVIEDFIIEISNIGFLEVLVYGIVNTPLQIKFDFKDIFSIVKDKFIDILINLGTQGSIDYGDSFQEYTIRKGIASLLREQDESIIDIFRKRLLQLKEDMPPSLIETVGYLKREDCIELLAPFFYHKNLLIRRAVILALADIGGKNSIEIISRILKEEKDRDMVILAKDLLRKLKREK